MFPVTHGLIGWSVSQPLLKRKDRFLVTAAALLPDLDGMGIVISMDYYSKYHHVFGHCFLFGIFLSIISSVLAHQRLKTSLFVFISFNTHILGDLLGSGSGWGIHYWWPMYNKQYEFSPPFQWELDSWQNFLVTLSCVVFMVYCALKKDRTIVELFSLKADAQVVAVFKKWFKKKFKSSL